MKFNCGGMDADTQAQQNPMYRTQSSSSSSTYTYFTEQAIRAGFASGSFGRGSQVGAGMFRECSDAREAIKRDLDKQRIREEIIAEENVRRRILEAEVRRELQMEREMMAVTNGGGFSSSFMPLSLPPSHDSLFEPRMLHRQPIGLEERIVMSLEEKYGVGGHRSEIRGFEMVPSQRFGDSPMIKGTPTPVLEDNKKKVIVLGKPKSTYSVTLSGSKRKPTPPVTAGSIELHSNGSKKKLKEEWSCAVCQVTATSERALNEHLQGKKHQVKEAALIAQKTGANFGLGVAPRKPIVKPVKLALTTVDPSSSEKKPKIRKKSVKNLSKIESNDSNKNEEHKREKFKFWCEMCHVGAFSEKVMNNHKGGKRHLANLLELDQNSKTEPEAEPEVKTVNGDDNMMNKTGVVEEKRI